jgi:hypothetical protein
MEYIRQLNELTSINSDNYEYQTKFCRFHTARRTRSEAKSLVLKGPLHKGMSDCVYREEGIMCGGSSGASMAAAVKAAASLKVRALDTNIL